MAVLHTSSTSQSGTGSTGSNDGGGGGPRRTSSSFKHVKHNSLVTNSPFKSPPPSSSQQPSTTHGTTRSTPPVSASAGRRPPVTVNLYTSTTASSSSSSSSSLSKSASASGGGGSMVGLGISANTKSNNHNTTSTARKSSSSGGGGSGGAPLSHRRGSTDNNGTFQHPAAGGAVAASVRFPSNDNGGGADGIDGYSPDVKSRNVRKPRQSMGLAKLDRGGLVSRSPFLLAGGGGESQGSLSDSNTRAAAAQSQYKPSGASPAASGTSPVAAARARFEGSPSTTTTTTTTESPSTKMPSTASRSSLSSSTGDVFSPGGGVTRIPSSGGSGAGSSSYRRSSPSLGGRERSSPRHHQHQHRHVSPLHSGSGSGGVRRSTSGSLRTERISTSPSPSPSHAAAARSGGGDGGTPTKSSITSRRLKGPRLEQPAAAMAGALGSPSKKTVTFRSVPEVKEFEIEKEHGEEGETSVEVDEDDEEEEEYETEEEMEDVDLLAAASSNNRASILYEVDPSLYSATHPAPAPDASSANKSPSYGYHRGMEEEEDDDDYDESTDGAGDDSYMDTLVEDGYFSPPEPRSVSEMPGPRADLTEHQQQQQQLHVTSLQGPNSFAAAGATLTAPSSTLTGEQRSDREMTMLATPNLGSPLDLDLGGGAGAAAVDEVGIPFGRTHHAERAHAAHVAAVESHHRPAHISQPDLPHQGYEAGAPIIRSQDVTQPALQPDQHVRSTALGNVQAHQDGPFEDPFVTLQTATSILSPPKDRQESGVPLGRTSHVERAKAARMLATQNLGLGMPRRPAFAEPYEGESEDGSADEASDGEDGYEIGATLLDEPAQIVEEPRRALPKPPQIPQRVEAETVEDVTHRNENDADDQSPEKPAHLSYNLPALGNSTSPLLDLGSFRTSSPLKSASTTSEDLRPLTPPQRRSEPKEDSPHHIPEFNFGGDDLSLEPDMTTSEAFRMVEDLLPKPNKAQPNAQVRQRISKDMIRQRMEQKRTLEAESPPQPPPKERSISPARARPDLSSLRTRSAQEVLEGGLAPVSPLEKLVQGNDDGLAAEMERVQLSSSQSNNTAQPQTPTRRIVSLTGQHGAGVPDVFLEPPVTSPALKKGRGSIRRVSHGHTRTLSDSSVIPEPASPSRLAIKGLSNSSSSILSSLEDELEKIAAERNYRVRESKQKIVASSNGAGDVDAGRAWRQLRKPSDMNEFAAELREIRARKDQKEKAFGTIFVKVLGIESVSLPLPSERTAFCITLDNGIDYIRTPYSQLQEGARVNQEFALVEHANFEFTLGLEIRRDPHIVRLQQQANAQGGPPALLSDAASTTSSKPSGFRGLFHSPRKEKPRPMPAAALPRNEENICRFFSSNDSTIGRSHIAFKPIAKNCDARLLEIRYPMYGVHQKDGKRQICKITLQMFRLPPLPGLTSEQLPQSIDECIRGMRHHAWHQHEYHEGTLTQRGGDCKAPRRRHFKIIGGSLVASNEVTKKHVISIDLRKAVAVQDENKARERGDEPYSAMPRSFSIAFKAAESITFWCDTDEDKSKWLQALEAIVGKVPSNPLWAEVLAAKMRAARARSASGLPPASPSKPSVTA